MEWLINGPKVFDNKKRQRYVTQQDDSELGTLLEEEYES